MIQFTRTQHHPQLDLLDCVGILPHFFTTSDPRPAVAQHDAFDPPGGPWSDFSANWTRDPETEALQYGSPSDEDADPPLLPLAFAVLPLTRERIVVYPHAWVAIVQDDGTFTIDRRD